jgi:hypothetical protein
VNVTVRSPLLDAVADGLAAAGRARVALADIERFASRADASLMSSHDRRQRIADTLVELERRGVLKLPAVVA